MSSADINSINNALANIQAQINNITGTPLISYNQINRISSQQGNIYDLIFYGNGNLNTTNLFVNNRTTISGNLIDSTLTFSGNLMIPNGNITSTIGNIVLTNGNILSTRGNIVSSNGNLNSTIGNININNGNINITRGNVIVSNGDANIGGTLYSDGISTIAGQPAFKVQYGTTATVDTDVTVTFDTPFTVAPTVLVTGYKNTTDAPIVYIRSLTATSVYFFAKDVAANNYGTLQFMWVAFGI